MFEKTVLYLVNRISSDEQQATSNEIRWEFIYEWK